MRRLWTRPSDLFVFWFMVLGIAGVPFSAIDILTGSHDVLDLLDLPAAAWIADTTWAERRRRHRSGSSNP